MIIVLEGISAAGKSTYAKRFGAPHWIPEFDTLGPAPESSDPVGDHAAFWLAHNIRRFEAALEVERRHGFAVCDTEPLKCHFDWCCARAGFRTMELFDCTVPLIREAIAAHKIGFGNRYYVKRIDPSIARAQKEGDRTRTRRNFEMHLALQPHLIAWFEALSHALPDRVEFEFPEFERLHSDIQAEAPEDDPRRFDVSVFDALVARLPR